MTLRTRRSRLTVLGIAGLLVVVGGAWALLHDDGGTGQGAAEAARVVADLPAHRSAALDPELNDDLQAVPAYPASTTIALDQGSWVQVGKSASAYATVTPPGQRVLVYFARLNGRWGVTQIETQP